MFKEKIPMPKLRLPNSQPSFKKIKKKKKSDAGTGATQFITVIIQSHIPQKEIRLGESLSVKNCREQMLSTIFKLV